MIYQPNQPFIQSDSIFQLDLNHLHNLHHVVFYSLFSAQRGLKNIFNVADPLDIFYMKCNNMILNIIMFNYVIEFLLLNCTE